jgi:hypothetical protein
MSESAFQPNTHGLQQLATELRSAGQRALNDVWKVLRRWGQEYRRRVMRVVPVEYGTLRQSFQVLEQNDGQTLAVTLGTSLKSQDGKPYPLYLEFGTDRIAGGKVKAWQPGDEPVMEWPAKMAGMVGSKRHERAVNIAQRAFTKGQGEQMPFLRPVGYEIAPRIIEDCRVAIRDGFAAVMRGRRF